MESRPGTFGSHFGIDFVVRCGQLGLFVFLRLPEMSAGVGCFEFLFWLVCDRFRVTCRKWWALIGH